MCIEHVENKKMKKWRVGYKVVLKSKDNSHYLPAFSGLGVSRVMVLHTGKWENSYGFPRGFFFWPELPSARTTLSDLTASWKGRYGSLVIVKVAVKNVFRAGYGNTTRCTKGLLMAEARAQKILYEIVK